MSVKRQATTELNHDNWDQDDPSEHEEMGMFKSAPKEVLEKRVIRTAKRRTQASGDEPKKSVFSGFGGFNKSQPSSFDFLANLTNGNKTTNGTATNKNDSPVSTGLFSSKPTISSPSSGLFSIAMTSSPVSKPTFGISTATTSLFGGSNTATTQSPFNSTKTEPTLSNSPFKMQISASSNAGNSDTFKNTTATTVATFGTSLTSSNSTLFSNNTNTFKMSNTLGGTKTPPENDSEKKTEQTSEKKLKYYSKLKGLNESVSDWIKKHVEETPLCILTPIFKDYEKYLKEIQDEYKGSEEEIKGSNESKSTDLKPTLTDSNMKISTVNNPGSSLFSSSNTKQTLFGTKVNTSFSDNDKPPGNLSNAFSSEKPSGFSFGIKPQTSTNSAGGFSFGTNSVPQITTASNTAPFSFAPTMTAGSNGPVPFSFSNNKPFSFSSNITHNPTESTTEEKDDEDEPPKVEYTPVVEENSIFDKKCKVFVKKDGNFADKGVGTLYIKKIEEKCKYQLLVRANTNLGNVLLNFILSSSIPTQRLGKNNVMLVCIPTPETEPPPTPILIRVKTSEEADELLETLNKYKG